MSNVDIVFARKNEEAPEEMVKQLPNCPVCGAKAYLHGDTVDEVLHAAHCAPAMYKRTPDDIRCKICKRRLKTYYAEERLYSVKCFGCGYVALVKAGSPSEAAKVFGVEYGCDTE